MQRAMRFSLAVSLFFLGSCRRVQMQTDPMSKVVELLNSLVVKIEAEGMNATKTQEEFQAACKDESKNFNFSIVTSTYEIADANATIGEETATIQKLNDDISKKRLFLAENGVQMANAAELRKNESAVFQSGEAELLDLVDTLRRAIGTLQNEVRKNGSFVQGAATQPVLRALASLSHASTLVTVDASRLSALVQSDEDADESRLLGAPDADVYASQSDIIVDTLEGLLEEAQGELMNARKAEVNAAHNFKMEQQLRETDAKNTKEALAIAEKLLAESTDANKVAMEKLATESKFLFENQAALETLTKDCTQGALDFDAETKSRAEELKALGAALKALAAAGNATALTYNSGAALLQRSQGSSISQGSEVTRLLRDLAKKERTPELAQLASRVAFVMQHGTRDGANPFAKVKALIIDLLTKLEGEATADEKCNEDIVHSQAESDEKTLAVQKLTANIDRWSSEAATLGVEIGDLRDSLVELRALQAKMGKARKDAAAEHKQRKADLTDGLAGVGMAIKVLTEYYVKQGKSHEAAEGSSTGIIGMLEVIQSDFSRDLAAAEEMEYSAQSTYEATSKTNEIELVRMEKDVEYKIKEVKSLERYVKDNTMERSSLQEELDAVNEYLDERTKQCTEKALTYEERKERRKNEIDGLNEALEVLESLALLQQRARHA